MTVDPFEKRPFRTSKSGGTKCTTCEIATECHPAAKCIYPLLCVTINMPSCGYDVTLARVTANTNAVQYDCDLDAFDLSVVCGGYEIDFLLTYEEVYGQPSAVLRSYARNVEVVIPFTEAINSRCPDWTFDLGDGESISVRKYELVSIGWQRCVNSGPDDCTAGRCLPRYLCASIYTVDRPDEPYTTTLSWYSSSTVTLPAECCCQANVMPEILIARVVNYSSGCSCIAPARLGSVFWPPNHEGNQITDGGALIHMRYKVAEASDAFVSGYPFVPEGSPVWVSEGDLGDLAPLCPSPSQTETYLTHLVYGRSLLWCDPSTGGWSSIFETVDITESLNAGSTDYLVPFNRYNPYSTVHSDLTSNILSCNPFAVRVTGITEEDNCFDTEDTPGSGVLELLITEFIGWEGEDPTYPGSRITLYSEVVNAFAPVQTVANDCLPKLHIAGGADTFKGRTDRFSITKVWPAHVFDGCSFEIDSRFLYQTIQRVVIVPQGCEGCTSTSNVVDPYSDVQTNCCPSPIPQTLYATAVDDFDCPCADGTVVVLRYDATEDAWIGEAVFGDSYGCGTCTVNMRLACTELIASVLWQLEWGFGGRIDYIWTPQVPVNDLSFACDPFMWETRSVSSNTCCNPSLAASNFHWVITT